MISIRFLCEIKHIVTLIKLNRRAKALMIEFNIHRPKGRCNS
jgi:hypothetical protein